MIYSDIKEIIKDIFAAATWWKRKQGEVAKELSGKWSNEGNIGEEYTHYVDVELEVADGKASGVVESRNLETDSASPILSLIGEMIGRGVVADLIHVRHGEVLNYGRVRLELNGDNLEWSLLSEPADFFPNRVELFRLFTLADTPSA